MALTVGAEHDPEVDAELELVHADSLRFFPRLVADLGGDPDALLRHVGIDPSLLSKRGSSLGYRAMANLLEHAATELQCADFGMRLATLQGGGKVFGPMGVVMRNSNTLDEALDYVVKHIHAYSLAARMRFERDRASRRVLVAFEVLLDRLPDKRQVIEQALLLANLNAIESTGGQARVRQVLFRHQPVSSLRTYRDYFGCEVRFDQKADGVVFTAQDLLCPIVDPDAQLYEIATSFIDTRFTRSMPPVHALVRGLMLQHLGSEDCTNERIAAELCLHARTLHRRLKAEGKSFQEIKDEVRRDVALFHLQHSDMPLTRIAEKLGYAESSVFSRSCLRWFGASPRQLRSRAERSGHHPGRALKRRYRGRGNRLSGTGPSQHGGASRAHENAPRLVDGRNSGCPSAGFAEPGGGTAMLRVDALQQFTEVVTLLGGDADALLAKAQIDPAILANRHAVISFRSFVHLLERAAVDLLCPGFGMRLASVQDVAEVLGPLEVVMRNSGTLREAFRYCAEHIQAYSSGTQLSIQEHRARHSVFVRFETIKDDVRRDIALRYLNQPAIPLIRVAELLGYSSTSVLSRSCHRWFSASPRQLRASGDSTTLEEEATP